MICACGCRECDIEWTNKGHNEVCKKCGEKQFYPANEDTYSKSYSFGSIVLATTPCLFANRHSRDHRIDLDRGEGFGA